MNNRTQKFHMLTPLATHHEVISCREAECPNYEKGFMIPVDPQSERGQRQAQLIRESGRRFEMRRSEDCPPEWGEFPPGLIVYCFYAGQDCFGQHMRALDKAPILLHDGRRHLRGEDFNEDFNEQSDAIKRAIERG